MRRRKIDSRRISPRRPDVTTIQPISSIGFATSLKRFSDEYLRGAMEVEIDGSSASAINISLHEAAYMMRLMVEFGGEESVLKTKITIGEHLRIDTYFPSGCPSIEDMAEIAKAGRAAGFFFEIRDSHIIMKAEIKHGAPTPVYVSDYDAIVDIFVNIFFM